MMNLTLSGIYISFLIILERQCVDQLLAGKNWHPIDFMKDVAENVPTTNKASESDFAVLDLLIHKPNASVQTIQGLTMWSRNKTLDWLN